MNYFETQIFLTTQSCHFRNAQIKFKVIRPNKAQKTRYWSHVTGEQCPRTSVRSWLVVYVYESIAVVRVRRNRQYCSWLGKVSVAS